MCQSVTHFLRDLIIALEVEHDDFATLPSLRHLRWHSHRLLVGRGLLPKIDRLVIVKDVDSWLFNHQSVVEEGSHGITLQS